MTLEGLRKHKIFLIVMSIAVIVVAIFVATRSNVTEAAYAEGQECENCHQGNLAVKYTTAAKCDVAGAEVYECLNCYEEFRNTIPALEHNYVYDGTQQPSTQTHGTKCTLCGATSTESHNVVACTGRCSVCNYQATTSVANHNYVYDSTQTTSAGTHGIKCTVCGATTTVACTESEEYVDMGDGENHVKTCKVCGDALLDTLTAHTPEENYTSTGSDMHIKKCTECEAFIASTTEACIPEENFTATGSDMHIKKCSKCQDFITSTTEACTPSGIYEEADDFHYQLCSTCNDRISTTKEECVPGSEYIFYRHID